ncbi:MAG TPA: DUF222 domain-containing protein [Actinomycetaceae bacterium]|nr:DUF222 domain-containing protein [Actinomycetaceae bacterium]
MSIAARRDDSAPASAAPVHEAVRAAAAAVSAPEAIGDADLHELDGQSVHDLIDLLESAARRVKGLQSAAFTVAEANGLWATSNARSFSSWLAGRTQSSTATAHRAVKEARVLREHLPATQRALAEGEITAEHVSALLRYATKSPAQLEALRRSDVGERFLLDHARQLPASEFRHLVRNWSLRADPGLGDRSWRDDSGLSYVTLAPTLDGYHLSGWLDTASGKLLETAIGAAAGPPTANDPRTASQRRADSLVQLAKHALDSGDLLPHARIRPHLSVTVSYDTLQALAESMSGNDDTIGSELDTRKLVGHAPATFDDGEPLPPALLARLACDSELSRIVFGPKSTVLDVGRTQRIFPAHHVRAITARDRHCQYPGCYTPPGYCEVHHSMWWYKHGGKTSVDKGILLCWHHHTVIHRQQIDIHRRDGEWHFTDRFGQPINAPPALRWFQGSAAAPQAS